MKRNSKILIWSFSILLCCLGKLNAQVTDSTQTDFNFPSDSSNLTAPETVSLADTIYNIPEAGKTTSRYQPGEVIRIYSGKHDGNNVIRTVEIPVPEGRQNEQAGYVPR